MRWWQKIKFYNRNCSHNQTEMSNLFAKCCKKELNSDFTSSWHGSNSCIQIKTESTSIILGYQKVFLWMCMVKLLQFKEGNNITPPGNWTDILSLKTIIVINSFKIKHKLYCCAAQNLTLQVLSSCPFLWSSHGSKKRLPRIKRGKYYAHPVIFPFILMGI